MTFTISIILYLLTGSIAGILAGLLGIGGGAIVVPALAYIFLKSGMPTEHIMHLAIGTSLTAMIFTSLFSTQSHHKFARVEWNVVKKFVPGIIIGVILGALFSTKLPTHTLTIIFGIYLLFIAIQMFFKKDKKENISQNKPFLKESNATMAGGGVLIGLLSGLLGVGGGTLTVPFLTYLGKSMHKAIGTSAACGFFITIVGTISFILLSTHASNLPKGTIGYIYLPAALGITLMSSICAPIGSKISGSLSPKILSKCFSILLMAVALKMLI
ncbi:sulfite exporter TauE/SafE family protein [Fluviispira multicolorata]|uniref:Probable membrane transporter protein n=1 Tax=Fluviispira multicolorata TaxID=2654512 RepID=A0A833JB33_9BACT|nr:sulfite exporter TauE/SafE family protein [Fluviispira multicolorata]KAB8028583.1 TSUP family transporter [Fluviispira multicolorata]